MTARNKKEAETLAKAAVKYWALRFASVAWIPGSHYIMSAGDVDMVMPLGRIYQVEMGKTKAGNVFATVAAPLTGAK